jgi:S1-C subfamily serine protease
MRFTRIKKLMATCDCKFLVVLFFIGSFAHAQESGRLTPAVSVIADVKSAILPLFTVDEKTGSGGAGSCAVIHSSGFLLTADHVTTTFPGVVMFGLDRVEYETVGRMPERDIAILKLKDNSRISSFIPLGNSSDLLIGEPIVVGGNPSGRGIVFTQGNINAASIEPSWPNVLIKSYWRNETQESSIDRRRTTGGRPDFIQFDASSNRGNSGGPVVNYDRRLVGLVALKSLSEEGVNWAVPVDRIRMLLPHLVAAEEIGDFCTGIEIDPLAENGRIQSVLEDSPAWKAGLRTDDLLVEVDGKPIEQAYEWLFHLWGRQSGDQLNVKYRSNETTHDVVVTLDKYKVPAVQTTQGKTPGVRYDFYEGLFPTMPAFDKLVATKSGRIESVDRKLAIGDSQAKTFGIVFSGYIEFPDDGLYRVHLGSDDGSKFYLNDRLVIDNDLAHPMQSLSRWARVSKGLVPFRLEHSEVGGEGGLELTVSKDVNREQKLPVRFFQD